MKILDFNQFDKFYKFSEINEEIKTITYGERDKITPEMRAEVKDQVERCVMRIVGLYPFFSEFIYSARFIYDPPPIGGRYINTMATDGHNYFINSYFVSQLSDKQVIFILCHEILHITMLHNFRGLEHVKDWNAQTATVWNWACDYEINIYLVDMHCPSPHNKSGGFSGEDVKKDIGALYDDKYREWPAEDIYEDIKGQMPPPPPQPSDETPDPIIPKVGDYVKIKKGKGYGKIVGINGDGTFKIEDVTKEEVIKNLK